MKSLGSSRRAYYVLALFLFSIFSVQYSTRLSSIDGAEVDGENNDNPVIASASWQKHPSKTKSEYELSDENYHTNILIYTFSRKDKASANHKSSDPTYINADIITFRKVPASYCVSFVDVVDSTRITSMLQSSKLSRFYSTFLNFMGNAIQKSKASIVKNFGDSLLYYHPDTLDALNKDSFTKYIDDNLRIIKLHRELNTILKKENLGLIDYRISCVYGQVMLASSNHSSVDDMFGIPVNVCTKINRLAKPNTVVIGADLYTIVKEVRKYCFNEVNSFSLRDDLSYSVYSVSHKDDT